MKKVATEKHSAVFRRIGKLCESSIKEAVQEEIPNMMKEASVELHGASYGAFVEVWVFDVGFMKVISFNKLVNTYVKEWVNNEEPVRAEVLDAMAADFEKAARRLRSKATKP